MNAQMKIIEQNQSRFKDINKVIVLRGIYLHEWSMLFEVANLGDLNKPLTPKILSNPYHKITKHLVYIYSM